jgi:hypothetical protein
MVVCCSSASKLSSAGWGEGGVREKNWECWESEYWWLQEMANRDEEDRKRARERKREPTPVVFYIYSLLGQPYYLCFILTACAMYIFYGRTLF